VLAYLEHVQEDLLEHVDDFREPQAPAGAAPGVQPPAQVDLSRYRVNVFVDNGKTGGAPVVFERNPTYYNLTGRLECRAAFGTLVADFGQIKPGALHRANGGFLVLEARAVLSNQFSWEALKRALQTGDVRIENLAEQYGPVPTVTLRPEPIALDVKIVL